MKLLRIHAALSTVLLIVLGLMAFTNRAATERFDEITVQSINIVDSLDRVRITLDLDSRTAVIELGAGE